MKGNSLVAVCWTMAFILWELQMLSAPFCGTRLRARVNRSPAVLRFTTHRLFEGLPQ